MNQRCKVHAFHHAARKKFLLAAEVADHALLAEVFAEVNLNRFLGRDFHQADLAGKPIERTGLFERGCYAEQPCRLAAVAAGMDGFRFRIARRMAFNDQRIHLRHDENRRSRPSGIDFRIKAGDISGFYERIAEFFIFRFQKSVGLPFFIAGLRVLPEPVRRAENQLTLLFRLPDGNLTGFAHSESPF